MDVATLFVAIFGAVAAIVGLRLLSKQVVDARKSFQGRALLRPHCLHLGRSGCGDRDRDSEFFAALVSRASGLVLFSVSEARTNGRRIRTDCITADRRAYSSVTQTRLYSTTDSASADRGNQPVQCRPGRGRAFRAPSNVEAYGEVVKSAFGSWWPGLVGVVATGVAVALGLTPWIAVAVVWSLLLTTIEVERVPRPESVADGRHCHRNYRCRGRCRLSRVGSAGCHLGCGVHGHR